MKKMAEREQIIKEKLENSGVFDFAALYSYAHTWFRNENYGVSEDKYAEKISGSNRDIDIEWKAMRGLSDYFKVEHKIKFEIRELTDVEVEIDGKRKKMNKGKVSIEITATLVRDPESKWETTPWNKFMRDVYNKYVIPSRVESMKDKTRDDAKKFKDMMKAFLELSGRR